MNVNALTLACSKSDVDLALQGTQPPIKGFRVKVIDAAGVFHRYTQLAESCAAAEALAFDRFGCVRLLSVMASCASATSVRRTA